MQKIMTINVTINTSIWTVMAINIAYNGHQQDKYHLKLIWFYFMPMINMVLKSLAIYIIINT